MTQQQNEAATEQGPASAWPAIQLRLPPTLRARVQQVALREGNQLPAVCRRLLGERLDQIEAES